MGVTPQLLEDPDAPIPSAHAARRLADRRVPAAVAGARAGRPPRPTPAADPTIKLRCALVIPAGSPARERVGCGWTALTGVDVKRLSRLEDRRCRARPAAPPVARVAPDEPLRIVDHHIRRGHTYTYRVVAIGTDGARVGISNAESLRVGCAGREDRASTAPTSSTRPGRACACHWAKADRPGAAALRARALGRRRRARARSTGRRGRTPVVLRHGRRRRPVDPVQGVRARRGRPHRGRRPGRHRAASRPSPPRSDGAGAIRAVDTGTLAGVDGRTGWRER